MAAPLISCTTLPGYGWKNPIVPPEGKRMSPFIGYNMLCLKEGEGEPFCTPYDGPIYPPSGNTLALLRDVDREVRDRLVYRDDPPTGGFRDLWSRGDHVLARGYGDCEDWAAAAALLLLSRGVRPEDLFIIGVAATGSRVSHLILTAKTPLGLVTCGDTFVRQSVQLNNAYWENQMKHWMCLAQPGAWYSWGSPA